MSFALGFASGVFCVVGLIGIMAGVVVATGWVVARRAWIGLLRWALQDLGA